MPVLSRAERAASAKRTREEQIFNRGYRQGSDDAEKNFQRELDRERENSQIRKAEQSARVNCLNALANMTETVCRTFQCLANDFMLTAPPPTSRGAMRIPSRPATPCDESPFTSDKF
jgi:hypothetical protein